jgi:hypothetical protein
MKRMRTSVSLAQAFSKFDPLGENKQAQNSNLSQAGKLAKLCSIPLIGEFNSKDPSRKEENSILDHVKSVWDESSKLAKEQLAQECRGSSLS